MSDNFVSRLTETSLASKTDIANFVKNIKFGDELKHLNKKFTLNKTKHVLAKKNLKKLLENVKLLSAKVFSLFLGRMCFTWDEGPQNLFVY